MSEEIYTVFEKDLIANPDAYLQEKDKFIRSPAPSRSPSPNRFDDSTYTEDEYESDDPNDLNYEPCDYRFCDESADYDCDNCERPLCEDHTYVEYNKDNYYCTFCLTSDFDKRIKKVSKDVRKQKSKVDLLHGDINLLFFLSGILYVYVLGYISYYIYNYDTNLV